MEMNLETVKRIDKGELKLIMQENGMTQEIFTFSNYDYKKNNFTPEEILQKEKDIRKIMKPLTEKENVKMFENVGFKKIDVFYKSLNFVGWVLVK